MKIFSYNCRGLNNQRKQIDLFKLFKEKKADILCLQETHFHEKIEKNVYAEWDGTCYFSHGSESSRGVAILIRKILDIIINEYKRDINGQFIALNLTYNNNTFTLMNIYAPNSDNPTFFENVFEQVDSFDTKDFYIICGDFNLVLDPEIDYETINLPITVLTLEES